MKVLIINEMSGATSTGRICTDLAGIIKENDSQVMIAYGRKKAGTPFEDISYRISNDWQVKVAALETRLFDNAGFANRLSTVRFLKWVESYKPDVIHMHNLHGYYINVQMLIDYICEKKIPVVWTLHDCWPFTGHAAFCDIFECTRWISGCGKCPARGEYPKSFIDNSKQNWLNKRKLFTAIHDMVIVTPSKWLAALTKESFLGKYPIKVITNGINVDSFSKTPSDIAERLGVKNKKIVLGVANVWERRKGLDDFVRLSTLLDDSYQIVLVGLSEKQREALPEGIVGIGRTESIHELAELYTAADVFVNPTYSDNYPTTNLEAQACGTPVLTYRTGGSPESVPCDNVVEQGDVEALAEKIVRGNLEVKKDLVFDKYELLSQYLTIYEELVK